MPALAANDIASTIAQDARLWQVSRTLRLEGDEVHSISQTARNGDIQSLIARQDEFVADLLSRLLVASSESAAASASVPNPSHVAPSPPLSSDYNADDRDDLRVARHAWDALKAYSDSLEERVKVIDEERKQALKIVAEQEDTIAQLRLNVKERAPAHSPILVPPVSCIDNGNGERARDIAALISDSTRLSFVIVFLDLTSAPFSDALISQGKTGGLQAASQLRFRTAIGVDQSTISNEEGKETQIIIFAYYDKTSLASMLLKFLSVDPQCRVITSGATFDEFCMAFNSAELTSLVDIGRAPVESKTGPMLMLLGSLKPLKRIYMIGVHPDAVVSTCPSLCPGGDRPRNEVITSKLVAVNFLEDEEHISALEFVGWRTITFQRLFSHRIVDTSCWKQWASTPYEEEEQDLYDYDNSHQDDADSSQGEWSPVFSRISSKAHSPKAPSAAAKWRRINPAVPGTRFRDEKKAGLNPGMRPLDTNRGFLQQNPQICVFHYLSGNGCTARGTCGRAHDYDLNSRQIKHLREDVARHPCKELRNTGRCTWAETNSGTKCMYSHVRASSRNHRVP
ncbi:BZ3500_MvSof-1268-A1-R1_Chr4-3g07372 [Microbotryum saponariae]|uniref:BZ3500_MvSof-1268-A1-R1_Chr4-3g07372 protein n=1 Tax=Microbotryum saponariae TaxID=289078 RepID=A0A2X0KWZ6_9BASI|nr:BZ3500_MvSof-1268-A1-R1_Chr4-3g07372 [Microbotryum saponariae]SDA07035.1 BZ3501_MvSof-1269-A2-R1_Chr4-2g07081 [Microbotryum saponariae]